MARLGYLYSPVRAKGNRARFSHSSWATPCELENASTPSSAKGAINFVARSGLCAAAAGLEATGTICSVG